MVRKQIDNILEREMDRKEFLKHAGLAVVAIVGVSSVLSVIGRFGGAEKPLEAGYGSTAYGG